MPMMGFRFTKRTTLRLAVAISGLCAAAPAFAGTETCTVTFDANGHASSVVQFSGTFAGGVPDPQGVLGCSGSNIQTNVAATYYSALSFNPATVTINQVNANS